MLKDVLDNCSLKVMNFEKLCGEEWTRVQTVNGTETKCVLDYCIIDTITADRLLSMVIDENKILCPFRLNKTKEYMSNI